MKLIVLDRIIELKSRYPNVMQQVVMDLLRVLSGNPDMDIKRKVLETAMALVSIRNVDSVMGALKKELQKSQSTSETLEYDKQNEAEYRKLLVKTFHECAVKFPEVAHNVLSVMDYLGDTSGPDVILFVREIVETTPKLRAQILEKLCQSFTRIQAARVFRVALWILGDYSETVDQIQTAFSTIKNALSDLLSADLLPNQTSLEDDDDNLSVKSSSSIKSSTKSAASYARPPTTSSSIIRADGTYATQSGYDHSTGSTGKKDATAANKAVTLRGFIEENNFYLGAVICNTLCKLTTRLSKIEGVDRKLVNQIKAESMLIMTIIVRVGNDQSKSYRMDKDTLERIYLCVKLLAQPDEKVSDIIINARSAFTDILRERKAREQQEQKTREKEISSASQPDNLLNVTQLKGKKFDAFEFEEEDITKATSNAAFSSTSASSNKLSRVTQLTGFSDPVYAEGVVTVHQFDILLDVLVVNQTNSTLQNLTLELATVGDLKLCERPQTYTLAPYARQRIKANIKVSSTETGIIFGNIVYDVSGAGNETACVILNDVHIDIMDYIAPATCDDMQFRSMWFEFEWENKIPVKSSNEGITLRQFLDHITKVTNMNCLTPESALAGDCEFLSANLYARSCFGEDALANVSIEKLSDGKIDGFVRIRSKTQGIALSLGDKITKEQKSFEGKNK